MRKRIVSLLLALLLCLSFTVPALANNRNGVYILDEMEYLTAGEYHMLHYHASELSNELGMDIVYVLTYETDLEACARGLNIGNRPDQIMLVENPKGHDLFLFGKAQILTEAETQGLLDAYSIEPTYFSGVTAYLEAAEVLVSEKNSSGAFEDLPPEFDETLPRLVDDADLLSASEEATLLQQLDEISQRQQLDVVVVTANELDGKTAMEYADDFYDYNGYSEDGILLLVSMEQRDWWLSTCGYGITAFTDAGLEYISERFLPKLSKGEYAEAFEIFARQCDTFITQARTGQPYDVRNMPKAPFNFLLCLVVSLIIGLFAAGTVVWVLKGQLKSVRHQTGATGYSKSGSLRLTQNKETYLYSTMSSRPKPKEVTVGGKSISLGGSSTHRSSSGRSHGGRGGKF